MTHDCVICFEEIENSSDLIKTPCGHTFHNACLTPWFMSKDTCPMCRKNYGKERDTSSFDSDEEWDSEEYDSEEEVSVVWGFSRNKFPDQCKGNNSHDWSPETTCTTKQSHDDHKEGELW